MEPSRFFGAAVSCHVCLPPAILEDEDGLPGFMHRVAKIPLQRRRQLFDVLASSIGPDSAKLEFLWMRNHAAGVPKSHLKVPPNDLETMVMRRVMGEPLQYILGMTLTPATLVACR